MTTVSTTKMSSKGQVVIPEKIRKELNLKAGAQFVVMGDNDVVILKNITPPNLDDLDDLILAVRKKAKEAGIRKKDVQQALAQVRRKQK